MKTPFVGSWRSCRSNIPGYVPGEERLRFTEEGLHVWKVGQHGAAGSPGITHFILEEEGTGFRMKPGKPGDRICGAGWFIRIEQVGAVELAVTPQHGFTTFFRREENVASAACLIR